jgi:hypothetical protein
MIQNYGETKSSKLRAAHKPAMLFQQEPFAENGTTPNG